MRTILFVFTTLLSITTLSAQELQVPVALKHFVEQSFQKYPKVSEMNEMVNLNEAKVGLGKTAFFPTAMGDLSYRLQYPTPAIEFPGASGQIQQIKIQPADNYNASITLVQPIIDMRANSMLNKAKSDLDVSKDNLEGFKINLAYQIAQIYY